LYCKFLADRIKILHAVMISFSYCRGPVQWRSQEFATGGA